MTRLDKKLQGKDMKFFTITRVLSICFSGSFKGVCCFKTAQKTGETHPRLFPPSCFGETSQLFFAAEVGVLNQLAKTAKFNSNTSSLDVAGCGFLWVSSR